MLGVCASFVLLSFMGIVGLRVSHFYLLLVELMKHTLTGTEDVKQKLAEQVRKADAEKASKRKAQQAGMVSFTDIRLYVVLS